MTQTEYYCKVGDVKTIIATCYPETSSDQISWNSSDPSIVFIDSKTGQIVALQEGTVTITATAKDGWSCVQTATATVIVGNGVKPIPCATPTIEYENGKVTYNSETDGAKCHKSYNRISFSVDDQADGTVVLTGQFTISVYATAEGYLQSETATKTITLENVPIGESHDSDGTITIDNITDLINRYLQQE